MSLPGYPFSGVEEWKLEFVAGSWGSTLICFTASASSCINIWCLPIRLTVRGLLVLHVTGDLPVNLKRVSDWWIALPSEV
jgi:hypothetical protein